MRDFFRQEATRTVVRHVMSTPVNWADSYKLVSLVARDMNRPLAEIADNELWWEILDEDHIALCYELTSGTTGGPSNSERLSA